jgi:hypothetical protein
MFAEFGGLIPGTALTRARLHSQSEHSEEQIMNRKIGTTILLVAASCLGLSAQTLDLKANIPFNFQVGQVEMPSGEYHVSQRNGVLTVRKTDGHPSSAMVLTMGETLSSPPASGALIFNRYGNRYFLSSARSPYSTEAQNLPKTRIEKEYARAATERVETASIPLRTH